MPEFKAPVIKTSEITKQQPDHYTALLGTIFTAGVWPLINPKEFLQEGIVGKKLGEKSIGSNILYSKSRKTGKYQLLDIPIRDETLIVKVTLSDESFIEKKVANIKKSELLNLTKDWKGDFVPNNYQNDNVNIVSSVDISDILFDDKNPKKITNIQLICETCILVKKNENSSIDFFGTKPFEDRENIINFKVYNNNSIQYSENFHDVTLSKMSNLGADDIVLVNIIKEMKSSNRITWLESDFPNSNLSSWDQILNEVEQIKNSLIREKRAIPDNLVQQKNKLIYDKPKKIEIFQDEFETTAEFNERKKVEKNKLENSLLAWNKKVELLNKDYKKFIETLPETLSNYELNQILSNTISKNLGKPKVVSNKYIADLGIFHIEILPDNYINNCSNNIKTNNCDISQSKYSFITEGKISTDNAKKLKKHLNNGDFEVVINFKYENDQIQPIDGVILFNLVEKNNSDSLKSKNQFLPLMFSGKFSIPKLKNTVLDYDQTDSIKFLDNLTKLQEFVPNDLLISKSNDINDELRNKLVNLKKELDDKRNSLNQKRELEIEIAKIQEKLKSIEIGNFTDDLSDRIDNLQSSNTNSNLFAFFIGISNYSDMPPVNFADRSAVAVSNFFRKKYGIPSTNLVLLLDEKATARRIESRIRTMVKRMNEDDILIFYYAGHTAPDINGKNAFIIPSDSLPGFYTDDFFSLPNLYNFLSKNKAQNNLIILDTCFSGRTDQNTFVFGDVAPIIVSSNNFNIVNDEKISLLTSSLGDQIANSYQSKGFRLFTYFFLKKYLENNTFNQSVFEDIKKNVYNKSLEIGLQNEQSPFFDGTFFDKIIN